MCRLLRIWRYLCGRCPDCGGELEPNSDEYSLQAYRCRECDVEVD